MDARPPWVVVDGFGAQFGKRRAEEIQRYVECVAAGIGGNTIWRHLNRQVFL